MGYGSYELGSGPHRGEWGGYNIEAVCDREGCGADIDRGLSFLCGRSPGGDERGCGGYFCERHLSVDQQCEECERLAPRWTSLSEGFPAAYTWLWVVDDADYEVLHGVCTENDDGVLEVTAGPGSVNERTARRRLAHIWWIEGPEPPEFVNWWDLG